VGNALPAVAAAARELGMQMVYDISHNVAKEEEHEVDGKRWEGRQWGRQQCFGVLRRWWQPARLGLLRLCS
jgi:RNA-splicing ligase RtcB